ncbi:glycosyltransferase [Aquamicrobium terrae]|uniref:Cellulose synthase/poly-beta-1,6-N-acetylglucosamine synthase-like glycosyltransferase n=1 Tax=Aquamicrobium terrae TaxID=1324945 RepID=A0ABV2MYU9_9HYPH
MHRTVIEIGGGAGGGRGSYPSRERAGTVSGPAIRARVDGWSTVEEWRPVLRRLAIPPPVAARLLRTRGARKDVLSALTASGAPTRGEVIRALADETGLQWLDAIDPQRLVLSDDQLLTLLRGDGDHLPVRYLEGGSSVSLLLPSKLIRPGRMCAFLRARPGLAPRVRIVDEKSLRAALVERGRPLLSRISVNGLSDRRPDMSARVVANAWQGYVVGIVMALLPVGLILAPTLVLALVHVLATLFFFSCVALRLLAALMSGSVEHEPPPAPAGNLPTYSVLVALYKEADIVPDLLTALDWIVWPRDKLEIKLVCEADDHETLAAIRAGPLPAHIEVVEVPDIGPRTKPKALSYALPMTSGEFVVLYDAEDWPDPMQLAEAWARFRKCGPDVAVLQAPLEISNGPESLVARMFAFEYRALFRGLLPFLARHRLILPLGGTSNHFRRAALEEVGGWDPFNVTEDADLGLRLARFGYRAETLSSPTYEKAPRRLGIWVPQRTRWFKGWAQTFLVHMRHPVRLARDLGLPSFLAAQVLLAGMLASALLHPFLLATFLVSGARLLLGVSKGAAYPVLMALDVVNVTCGYLSFLLLGWRTMGKGQRRGFWKVVLLTPAYWAMMSWAGWRALWQLWRQPFRWEKTPHETMLATLAGNVRRQ